MSVNEDNIGLANADRAQGDSGRVLAMVIFARLSVAGAAAAAAACGALAMALATFALLIKGAPPGVPIGPHLSGLATFLPGYSVTWAGGLLGTVYGLLLGALAGFVLALLWNLAHILALGVMALRGGWLDSE